MMSSALFLTAIAVASALAAVLLLIRRYPVAVLRRWIHCPEYNALARVGLKRRESPWGNFTFSDVCECSVFQNEPISCEKECLRSPS